MTNPFNANQLNKVQKNLENFWSVPLNSHQYHHVFRSYELARIAKAKWKADYEKDGVDTDLPGEITYHHVGTADYHCWAGSPGVDQIAWKYRKPVLINKRNFSSLP